VYLDASGEVLRLALARPDGLCIKVNREELAAGLQQSLPTTLAFEYPTVAFLTHYLAEEVLALELDEPATESVKEDAHLETVLAEIEELSDSEIEDSLLKELEDAGY
jgi:microcystin synthetase protein McyG